MVPRVNRWAVKTVAGLGGGDGIWFFDFKGKEIAELTKKRKLEGKMSKNFNKKQKEQREQRKLNIIQPLHRVLNVSQQLHAYEDILLALKKCSRKMEKAEKEKEKE